jgi:hypothetical protein
MGWPRRTGQRTATDAGYLFRSVTRIMHWPALSFLPLFSAPRRAMQTGCRDLQEQSDRREKLTETNNPGSVATEPDLAAYQCSQEVERDSSGSVSEFVGLPVTDLQVDGTSCPGSHWQPKTGDRLAGRENRIDMRGVARQPVQLFERYDRNPPGPTISTATSSATSACAKSPG